MTTFNHKEYWESTEIRHDDFAVPEIWITSGERKDVICKVAMDDSFNVAKLRDNAKVIVHCPDMVSTLIKIRERILKNFDGRESEIWGSEWELEFHLVSQILFKVGVIP